MSERELEAFFAGLPREESRAFEEAITHRVTAGGQKFSAEACRNILEDRQDSHDESDRHVAYCAFFALATHLRRVKSYTKLEELVDHHGHQFEDRGLYPHVLSLLHKGKSQLEQALQYGKEAVLRMPDHQGVLHSFAETVVLCEEAGFELDEDDRDKARRAAERVIARSPQYAKYHSTLGRLQAMDGRHAEAKESIRRAIDLEEPDQRDYAIRLTDYQALLSNVQVKQFGCVLDEFRERVSEIDRTLQQRVDQATEELSETRSEMASALEELKKENLMILGFFTAIISVTIGSIQLLERQPFMEAAMLIIVLAGALLSVFAGFTGLFSEGRRDWLRTAAFFISGVVLIGLGLLVPSLVGS